VRGGTQQVSLNSNPPGAEATIDDHLRVMRAHLTPNPFPHGKGSWCEAKSDQP